jgi:hypothetical protein
MEFTGICKRKQIVQDETVHQFKWKKTGMEWREI